MPRFHGVVGFGVEAETAPGVFQKQVVEKEYYGDVTRPARRLRDSETLNDDLMLSNSFSILADGFAQEHFFEILYLEYQGTKWRIQTAEVKPPRIILHAGRVYNEH